MGTSPAYDHGFRSTSVRASVLARHGTGAIGQMRGIIELFLRLPLFYLPSEFPFFFPSEIFNSVLPVTRPHSFPLTRLFILHNTPSVLPGIAFSQHLTVVTGKYGVSEVLLSSFMASVVFSVFGAQPLCIAGVTGLSFAGPSARCPEPHLKLEALFPS
jgi:hypothetical protein